MVRNVGGLLRAEDAQSVKNEEFIRKLQVISVEAKVECEEVPWRLSQELSPTVLVIAHLIAYPRDKPLPIVPPKQLHRRVHLNSGTHPV